MIYYNCLYFVEYKCTADDCTISCKSWSAMRKHMAESHKKKHGISMCMLYTLSGGYSITSPTLISHTLIKPTKPGRCHYYNVKLFYAISLIGLSCAL